MASRTSRLVPNSVIGLIPMPTGPSWMVSSKPIWSSTNARTCSAPSVPASHSMPAYTSSVFSRNVTMSICSGFFIGEGTPSM